MLSEWVSVFKGLKYFVIIWWWVLFRTVTFRVLYAILQETGGDSVSMGRVMFLCCALVWGSSIIISSSVGLPVDFWALTWLDCFYSENLQYWNTRFFQYLGAMSLRNDLQGECLYLIFWMWSSSNTTHLSHFTLSNFILSVPKSVCWVSNQTNSSFQSVLFLSL